LSHSHGEGFLRFFEERCLRQGIYLFDEPESALSPSRQLEFLRLLKRMEQSRQAQVVMATHSPLLMSLPGADLLAATPRGFVPTTLEATSHYKLTRAYAADPHGFVREALRGDPDE
jgi:predicted ATPase